MATVSSTHTPDTPSLHITQEQGASHVVEISNNGTDYILEVNQNIAENNIVVNGDGASNYQLVVTQSVDDFNVVIGGGIPDYFEISNLPTLGTASAQNVGYFATAVHTHAISEVTGLQAALDAAALSGEDNVQSDWQETNPAADSFILNKPALFDGQYGNLTGLPTLFDGNYNSLSNLPTLFDGDYNSLTNTPTLFDGDYNSLTNLPTLFDGAYSSLTGLPTLFSESYNDLTDLPTLFSGAYADLTGKPTLGTAAATATTDYATAAQGLLADSAVQPADITGLATETYVDDAVADLVDSAPGTLDTLNELADALGDDPNFATTVTNSIATKAPLVHTHVAADVTDFDTEVSNNTSVTANTSKVTFPGFGTVAGTALEGDTALFSGAYVDLTGKPTLFDGDYNSLTNLPTLFDGAYSSLTGLPTLFSGSYNDLTNTPTLFSESYNDLTDLPTLFDGQYSSLTGLPTLFDGAYGSLTGTPDLTGFVPYANASGDVDLNNKNLDGVSTITSAEAMFGSNPASLRAFNVHGSGFNARLSLQGTAGSNPGVEMTTDSNTSRVLLRLQEVGTDGTSLQLYNEEDGGSISLKQTFDGDGVVYWHDTSAKDAGIRNNSGTMQFLNSGGSWSDMGSGSGGGGENNVQVDWNETDSADDAFILNKPTLFDGAYTSLTAVPATFTPSAHTHTHDDITDFDTEVNALITAAGGGGGGEANVQADWTETDSASDAFILNKPAIADAILDNHHVEVTLPAIYAHGGASVMDFDYTSQTQVLNLSQTSSTGSHITWGNDKFTVSEDGLYTVTASGQFNTVGIQRAMPAIYIAVNGVVQPGADSAYLRSSGNAFDDSASLTRTFDLTSGDEITLVMENIGNHSGTAVRARTLVFEVFSHTMSVVGVEGAGENNVQADWDETDSSSDAFILNKPTIGGGSVDDLTDVDTTTSAPSTGDVLEWDGSNWVPAAPSGGGDDPQFIWERHCYNTVSSSENTKYFWPGSSIKGFGSEQGTETSTAPSSFTSSFNTFKKISHRPQSGTYDLSVRFEVAMSGSTTGGNSAPDFSNTDIDCSVWKVTPNANGTSVSLTQIGTTTSLTLDSSTNVNKRGDVASTSVTFDGNERIFCTIKGNATSTLATAYAHWVYDIVATKTA